MPHRNHSGSQPAVPHPRNRQTGLRLPTLLAVLLTATMGAAENAPQKNKPLQLNLADPTLEQLVNSLREKSAANILLAEELRPLRIPEIRLTQISTASVLRSLEKLLPTVTLEITPGPAGIEDPATIFQLYPAKKDATCQVLKSGPRHTEKKALSELLGRANDAVLKACAARTKADPGHPLRAPSIESHAQTQLLFVSGSEEAVTLGAQILIGLGCETVQPAAGSPSQSTSQPVAPQSRSPIPSLSPGIPGLPGMLPGGISIGTTPPTTAPQNPATRPTARSSSQTQAERLSEIQAAHAEATRRLRTLEETSRTTTPTTPPAKPPADKSQAR